MDALSEEFPPLLVPHDAPAEVLDGVDREVLHRVHVPDKANGFGQVVIDLLHLHGVLGEDFAAGPLPTLDGDDGLVEFGLGCVDLGQLVE